MKKFEGAAARYQESGLSHVPREPTIVGSCGRVGDCVGGWVTTHNTHSLLSVRVVVVARSGPTTPSRHRRAPPPLLGFSSAKDRQIAATKHQTLAPPELR
jgi:hypothetical protein